MQRRGIILEEAHAFLVTAHSRCVRFPDLSLLDFFLYSKYRAGPKRERPSV